MKILIISMEVKKKWTRRRLMPRSQHDCLVFRVCQKAYVKTQPSVQLVPDSHKVESFQASFHNTSECSNYRSEKALKTIDCYGRERENKMKEDLERNTTLCIHA